jgi:ABC-type multidrug transport system ATPase subunit
VLAGRKTAGVTEGTISFGGQAPTTQFLRRYTGYVEQFDTLIGTLTVKEMVGGWAMFISATSKFDACRIDIGLIACCTIPLPCAALVHRGDEAQHV